MKVVQNGPELKDLEFLQKNLESSFNSVYELRKSPKSTLITYNVV